MIVKLFEVRDRMTFIPCFAFRLRDLTSEEVYLKHRAGFHAEDDSVFFGLLETGECQFDIFAWDRIDRTVRTAHTYVMENWDKLESGDVVDVEFIKGETDEPKKSEGT